MRHRRRSCWDADVNSLPFTLEVDRPSGLICAAAYEFWTLATLERFKARVQAEQEAIRRSGLRPLFLIDVRQHGVQSREVVEGLQAFARRGSCRAMKTAVVVESALYRFQAERIGSEPDHSIFRNYDEARQWLLADEGNGDRKPSLSIG